MCFEHPKRTGWACYELKPPTPMEQIHLRVFRHIHGLGVTQMLEWAGMATGNINCPMEITRKVSGEEVTGELLPCFRCCREHQASRGVLERGWCGTWFHEQKVTTSEVRQQWCYEKSCDWVIYLLEIISAFYYGAFHLKWRKELNSWHRHCATIQFTGLGHH